MSRESSPEVVRSAARRLDQRLVACAEAVERRPTGRLLSNPWVIGGFIVAFALLPRRFKKPVLKAIWPMALGLLKHR